MKQEMTRKFVFVLFLLMLTIISPSMALFAQENGESEQENTEEQDKNEQKDKEKTPTKLFSSKYRSKGDMVLAINLGIYLPLGFSDFSDEMGGAFVTNELGTDDAFLSAGGMIEISWEIYLTSSIRAGLQISPTFGYTKNQNLLYMIPVTGRLTWELQPIRQISIPIYLGLGMSFNYLDEDLHIDFIAKPGIGFYWNMDIEWSFGVDFAYWFIPQIYSDSDDTRIGHFLEISASVNYHF